MRVHAQQPCLDERWLNKGTGEEKQLNDGVQRQTESIFEQ